MPAGGKDIYIWRDEQNDMTSLRYMHSHAFYAYAIAYAYMRAA